MRRSALFWLHIVVGSFGFLCWTFWAQWTDARPPRRYEHWAFRLMSWADALWFEEERR